MQGSRDPAWAVFSSYLATSFARRWRRLAVGKLTLTLGTQDGGGVAIVIVWACFPYVASQHDRSFPAQQRSVACRRDAARKAVAHGLRPSLSE